MSSIARVAQGRSKTAAWVLSKLRIVSLSILFVEKAVVERAAANLCGPTYTYVPSCLSS
jgi:hypothetical protein